MSTALIAYGIDVSDLDMEDEAPWAEHYDVAEGMHEALVEWWRVEQGFVNPHPDPFGDDGGWKPEFLKHGGPRRQNAAGDKAWQKYSDAQKVFDGTHPLPIEIESHCTDRDTRYLFVIPGTVAAAYLGDPEVLDPELLLAVSKDEGPQRTAFVAFVNKYFPELEFRLEWLLYVLAD